MAKPVVFCLRCMTAELSLEAHRGALEEIAHGRTESHGMSAQEYARQFLAIADSERTVAPMVESEQANGGH